MIKKEVASKTLVMVDKTAAGFSKCRELVYRVKSIQLTPIHPARHEKPINNSNHVNLKPVPLSVIFAPSDICLSYALILTFSGHNVKQAG